MKIKRRYTVTGAVSYDNDIECFELNLDAESEDEAEKMYRDYLDYCNYKIASKNLVIREI